MTLLPVGPGLGQSFCFSLSVKREPENPLGFPGSRPQQQFLHAALGQSCVPHHPSSRLGWRTPSSSTDHGTLPHAVLLRGAGTSWHESCQHRRSGVCRALQLPRAGREHAPSQPRLCVCMGRNVQHWMPGLVALKQIEVITGEGLPLPVCLWWHWPHCPQSPAMVQRGSCAGTAGACSPGRALGALPALAHANCM